MASVVLTEKLESLRRCVRRLEEKRASTASELHEDIDRQDILALNISRAAQLCVGMASHVLAATEQPAPATMEEAFDGLERLGLIDSNLRDRLKTAVGFRNVAVHSYQKIDWDIVHAISWQQLDDFLDFARIVDTSAKDSRAR